MACVPKAFDRRIRTSAPPALRKTTLRTVWLVRPTPAGHVEPGMAEPTTGLAPQAVTQLPPSRAAPDVLCAPAAAIIGMVTATATAATATAPAATADAWRRRFPILDPACSRNSLTPGNSSYLVSNCQGILFLLNRYRLCL